jgi:hypothetical protein
MTKKIENRRNFLKAAAAITTAAVTGTALAKYAPKASATAYKPADFLIRSLATVEHIEDTCSVTTAENVEEGLRIIGNTLSMTKQNIDHTLSGTTGKPPMAIYRMFLRTSKERAVLAKKLLNIGVPQGENDLSKLDDAQRVENLFKAYHDTVVLCKDRTKFNIVGLAFDCSDWQNAIVLVEVSSDMDDKWIRLSDHCICSRSDLYTMCERESDVPNNIIIEYDKGVEYEDWPFTTAYSSLLSSFSPGTEVKYIEILEHTVPVEQRKNSIEMIAEANDPLRGSWCALSSWHKKTVDGVRVPTYANCFHTPWKPIDMALSDSQNPRIRTWNGYTVGHKVKIIVSHYDPSSYID